MTLQIGLIHRETITLFVISSLLNPVILVHPWLSLHDPKISWQLKELNDWSRHCQEHYINRSLPLPCLMTFIESPNTQNMIVPTEYQDLIKVCSKAKLPPHRPWDCAIELLPNTLSPKGYLLSIPEMWGMKDYIKETLTARLISLSPFTATFFL